MAGGETPAISFRGVVKRRGQHRALDDVTLEAATGSVVGLAGSNGAGKSTLLSIAAGLIRPTHGEVRVLGLAPRDPRLFGKVGVVLQDSELPPEERVEGGSKAFSGLWRDSRASRRRSEWWLA